MRKVAKKVATKKLERVVTNIPFSLFNELNNICDRTGFDRSTIVRMALREYINKIKREEIELTKTA